MSIEVRVHASMTLTDPDQVLPHAKTLIAETRKEPGCIKYELFKEHGSDNSYAMIETWESKEALDKHLKMEHVQNFRTVAKDFIKDPTVKVYKNTGL